MAEQTNQRRFQFSLRRLLIIVTVCAILLSILATAGRLINASYGYSLKATYSELPTNDSRLEEWLKAQAGVVPHSVHVNRKGTMVRIMFIMQRNSIGKPAFPDLENACDTLGYKQAILNWADNLGEQGW